MAELDQERFGGNGDGFLSDEDHGFANLCIWHDRNRNGFSERSELQSIRRSGVLVLELEGARFPYLDPARNMQLYHGGAIVLREGQEVFVRTVDVFFAASSSRQLVSPVED